MWKKQNFNLLRYTTFRFAVVGSGLGVGTQDIESKMLHFRGHGVTRKQAYVNERHYIPVLKCTDVSALGNKTKAIH